MMPSNEDIQKGKYLKFEEFEEIKWIKVKLEDNTVLWIKPIIISIKKLEKFNPDGSPIYAIQCQNVIRAFIPDNVKSPILEKM